MFWLFENVNVSRQDVRILRRYNKSELPFNEPCLINWAENLTKIASNLCFDQLREFRVLPQNGMLAISSLHFKNSYMLHCGHQNEKRQCEKDVSMLHVNIIASSK